MMRRIACLLAVVFLLPLCLHCEGFNLTVDGGGSDLPDEETSGGVSSGTGAHLESSGRVIVEAEHYTAVYPNWMDAFGIPLPLDNRNWYTLAGAASGPGPDPDDYHGGASGDAYVECLPDSRVTHDDAFEPGCFYEGGTGGAQLDYEIDFATTGTYYVWIRGYTTGTEDNGLHVGVDGEMPESGRCIQWCQPRDQWIWSSAKRDTGGSSCGVNCTIMVDINTPGIHTISFYQREDGAEIDRFLMTTDAGYTPVGAGPRESDRTNP